MAFSGVTSVKFTAAPGRKRKDKEEEKKRQKTDKGQRMSQSVADSLPDKSLYQGDRFLNLMSELSL